MGAFVKVVEVAVEKETDRVVNGIYNDMKGIVGGHSRTGRALAAIHIEGGGNSYFIGGTGGEGTKHLYYLNEGNGGKRITSTRKYDRLGREPGKLAVMNGMYLTYRNSVSPYAGIHFIESIAAKYGG